MCLRPSHNPGRIAQPPTMEVLRLGWPGLGFEMRTLDIYCGRFVRFGPRSFCMFGAGRARELARDFIGTRYTSATFVATRVDFRGWTPQAHDAHLRAFCWNDDNAYGVHLSDADILAFILEFG